MSPLPRTQWKPSNAKKLAQGVRTKTQAGYHSLGRERKREKSYQGKKTNKNQRGD